jgi:predicted aldo/keto reductase-like oxidoreductase
MGLGGIPITRLAFKDAVHLIRYAFDQGINFFDTAYLYGDSEEKMGAALEKVRHQVILATKTLLRDAEGASRQLEKSLKRLRTDYIDIYQLHNVSNQEALDRLMAPGGAYDALTKAREEGKIRHLGLTAHNVDMAAKACQLGEFATVQIPFNFIEQDPVEKLFPVARDKDMGIIAMKPLGGGLLSRPDLCFRFLRQYEKVVPIPGVESREELDENLQHYRSPQRLSKEDLAALDAIRRETGSSFCHRCEYCQPCPEGVEIWRVLLFRAQARRFPPEMAISMSRDPMDKAENCVQCGECEEKCPYGLPIPQLVFESLAYFREFCRLQGAA